MPTDETLEALAGNEKKKKKVKRLTLAQPMVVTATPGKEGVDEEEVVSEQEGELLVDPSEEETFEERVAREAAVSDPRIPTELPGPGETAARVAGFAGDVVGRPVARLAVQFPRGVAEGTQSIFDHLVVSLAANQEFNKLLTRLDNPKLTAPQREVIIDQMKDLEEGYIEANPAYQSYKNIDDELNARFKNDSNFQNAVSDFRDVTTSFPMLLGSVIQAAWDEDPEMMRQLGFMMSGGGIMSTVATLNPDKLGRNFAARPASVLLGLKPVGGIVARSPKAMQVLRGKAGKQADVLLRAIDTFDNTVRSGMKKVADSELPGQALSAVGEGLARATDMVDSRVTRAAGGALRGLGKVGEDVVRVGESARTPGSRQRITNLLPGVRMMTVGDIANSFAQGAKVGYLAGEVVHPGLAFVAARVLYPNTRLTRKIKRKVAQLLRHTSAQSNAGAELAVRGLMMASASQRNQMRSIADRIGKAFEEGDALKRRRGEDRVGDPYDPGMTREMGYRFTAEEGEFLPTASRAAVSDALEMLKKQRDKLLQDQRTPGSKKYTNEQIRQLNAEIQELDKAVKSTLWGGDLYPNRTLREAVDELGEVLGEAGVGRGIDLVKARLSNVADRNAILLQNGDVAEAVIRSIMSRGGERLKRAGVTEAKVRKLISDHAEDPYFGSNRLSATINIEGVGRIDLDKLVESVFHEMRTSKQREVMGQVASNAALRYSRLAVEAQKGKALKSEATKLGIGKDLEGVSLSTVTPDVYAAALARMLAKKDLTRGGAVLPQVIPASAAGPQLAAALRRIARTPTAKRKILGDAFGDAPSAKEVAAFEQVLLQSADELLSYVPDSANAKPFTDAVRRSIIDNPNLPKDVRDLAKSVQTGEYYTSPGLSGTLDWHARTQEKPGIFRDLMMLFKGNQTVRNVLPHIHNPVGNVGRAMLDYDEGPLQFARGMKLDSVIYLNHKAGKLGDYRRNTTPGSPEHITNRSAAIIDESGIANTDFVAGELLRATRSGLVDPEEVGPIKAWFNTLGQTKLGYIPRKLNELASKAYAAEDNLPKVHIGMNRSRKVLQDIFDLEPGSEMKIQTSPVSTRAIFRDAAGELREGTTKNPGRVLTDADVNKIVASDVRQYVKKYVVSYSEKSGLNRVVVSNPALLPFAPFFTFTDKAAGMGGRKGFVEHLLFSGDGISTTSPNLALREIKRQAALAARRAILVNSFQNIASRQRDHLAQALAYDPAVPNNVLFEMITDPDAIQFRDFSGMSVFGPGEIKYRAFAFAVGQALKAFGADKDPNLTKQQKQFFRMLDNGEVAHIGTIGSIFGIDRGPGLNVIDVVLNNGQNKYGQPVSMTGVLLEKILPIGIPGPVAAFVRELTSKMGDDLEVLSGRQLDKDDPPLNEKRKDFFMRRFLYQGGRKVRYDGSTKSLLNRRIKKIEQNGKVLRDHLNGKIGIIEGEVRDLNKQIKDLNKGTGSVSREMFIGEIKGVGPRGTLDAELKAKKEALKKTRNRLRAAEKRVDIIIREEERRLDDAYEAVKDIATLRQRIRAAMPKTKVRSLRERRETMERLR